MAFDVLEIAWRTVLPAVKAVLRDMKVGSKRHSNLSHRVVHLEEMLEARGGDATAVWMSFQMLHAELNRLKSKSESLANIALATPTPTHAAPASLSRTWYVRCV